MTKREKRIRINKVMVGWSNGERVNLPPSVELMVSDYGRMLGRYHRDLEEGYLVDAGPSAQAREEARCYEHEADHLWEQGHRVEALQGMLRAASMALPDEGTDFMFEDVQWLDPEEVVFWNPNVQEYLRLMRRCAGYCKQYPRLWPVLEGSSRYLAYRHYLRALGQWVHE